ncbi:MAG TPA: DMT family transporter [Oligoflexia bacterium]|nr:DMT family transporter [Oligoflexia bacterium]HMR25675.1 DMT family transporter [Oligoflexia bacterium]
MPSPYLGEIFALSTALTWATSVILFKKVSDDHDAMFMNLGKNIVAMIALVITLALMPSMLNFMPRNHFIYLLLSGIVGIGLADTYFFKSLQYVGASWIALIECLYSPFVVFFAWAILLEQLDFMFFVGGSLILLSLALPIMSKQQLVISKSNLKKGIFYGCLAMGLMAIAITVIKPILEQYSVLQSSSIRTLGGLLFLIVQSLFTHKNKSLNLTLDLFKRSGKMFIPAALMGSYLAYIFWIAGFKYTQASKAALLNQTSTVFTILLAYFFLKEPLHRVKVVSIVLAACGTLLILS